MARRYDELADDLMELSLHLQAEGSGRASRDCQKAASEIRQAEFIPPDPSEMRDVSTAVRDYVAEWRAFQSIDELERLREKRPYLAELANIAKVGPTTAERLHEEMGVSTIDDVRELDEDGDLEKVTGIGPKTATTIRRSIAQLDT